MGDVVAVEARSGAEIVGDPHPVVPRASQVVDEGAPLTSWIEQPDTDGLVVTVDAGSELLPVVGRHELGDQPVGQRQVAELGGTLLSDVPRAGLAGPADAGQHLAVMADPREGDAVAVPRRTSSSWWSPTVMSRIVPSLAVWTSLRSGAQTRSNGDGLS